MKRLRLPHLPRHPKLRRHSLKRVRVTPHHYTAARRLRLTGAGAVIGHHRAVRLKLAGNRVVGPRRGRGRRLRLVGLRAVGPVITHAQRVAHAAHAHHAGSFRHIPKRHLKRHVVHRRTHRHARRKLP